MPVTESDIKLVGREPELARLEGFLAGEGGERALLVAGEPGIGKTTLWEAGIAQARRRGFRVLLTRPRESELQLSFVGLGDLLEGVEDDVVSRLPPPQRHALEVALLRADPVGPPPQARAVATAFTNALRRSSEHSPLLVAIDDVQWLDRASAEAVAFAAHRLRDGVLFLAAVRSGSAWPLAGTFRSARSERIELGALSLGAMRRLLFDHLGTSVPRRALRRIFDLSGGNPLFALELGRRLAERGSLEIGEEIGVPDVVGELVAARVLALPWPQRRLLLAVALGGNLTVPELESLAGAAALEEAAASSLLVIDGGRVRPSHPLLAAGAHAYSDRDERRAVHLELAEVAVRFELRARHLALAARDPDETLAAMLVDAASAAASRGAVDEAVELTEQALRLTPARSAERPERLLAFAERAMATGDHLLATQLLADEADRLPMASQRARAYLMLMESRWAHSTVDESGELLERARAAAEGDPALHATATSRWSRYMTVGRVERIADAERCTLDVLPEAQRAGPEVEREVLYALAFARKLRGRPIDDLCERFGALSPNAFEIHRSPDRFVAERLGQRGDVSEARERFRSLLALAEERGEGWSYMWVLLGLCELELRAGEWDEASRLLDEWDHSTDALLFVGAARERCRALLALGRGRPDEAEKRALRAIEEIAPRGIRWDVLEATRVRGLAALLAHDPRNAARYLASVWAHLRRAGVEEPAEFPVAPDLVEALLELGRLDAARRVAARLTRLSEEQEHPWGLLTAKRCDALLAFAAGTSDDGAGSALEEAAAGYAELGLRFDHARTLLALGRARRRRKRWAAARNALEGAASAFEQMGSGGWVDEARSELRRVGARRPGPKGALTPAEKRAASLAAEGMSNKEIASALFVSVHTVEAHLSHAYAKLGVRSRTQLAGRLRAST